MQNDDGVKNALENKYYSFSLFCMKNSFLSKDAVVEVDAVDLKIPNVTGKPRYIPRTENPGLFSPEVKMTPRLLIPRANALIHYYGKEV